MTDDASAKAKSMPCGSPKGGTRYPRHKFSEALPMARKLVAKTHLAPQPLAIILSGVVGATSSVGKVKVSSLRQYGLLEGESSSISASDLARQIAASPADEVGPLMRQAVLTPSVFKALFDTFHGDDVTKAKLMQRAAALKVHPDETENCVEIYIDSLVTAGLLRVEGDRVHHVSASDLLYDTKPEDPSDEIAEDDASEDEPGVNILREEIPSTIQRKSTGGTVTVTIALDSSLDTDKLERQLVLLKKYGAI